MTMVALVSVAHGAPTSPTSSEGQGNMDASSATPYAPVKYPMTALGSTGTGSDVTDKEGTSSQDDE
ncbi:hypothetical protein H4R35_004905, partial [Dimargaris xerosporica]